MTAVRSRRANPTGDMTIVDHLRELRLRIAIILAVIVVPSIDPFSMCAMAIPMVILYEAAILVATLHDRHQERQTARRRSIEDTDDNHALSVEPATPLGALS